MVPGLVPVAEVLAAREWRSIFWIPYRRDGQWFLHKGPRCKKLGAWSIAQLEELEEIFRQNNPIVVISDPVRGPKYWLFTEVLHTPNQVTGVWSPPLEPPLCRSGLKEFARFYAQHRYFFPPSI